ncbi:MAG: putative manganese-dependent inorganic diphosphatase [Suipraeoptans sp.]
MFEVKRKIYVIGHKNPDTDSICSAIAYAHLKETLTGDEYVPKRAGQINEETHFILSKFGVRTPGLLSNVKLQVKDLDIHKIDGIKPKMSLRETWSIMQDNNIKTLPVLEDDELVGVISTGDVARSYMDEHDSRTLAHANTQYKNIAKTLDGEVVSGNKHGMFIKGRVTVGASEIDKMAEFLEADDLVIVGNREDAIRCAVDENASCIVLCNNAIVNDELLNRCEEKSIVIIKTPFDTFTTTRLINQSAPVKHYMSKGPLTTFQLDDYVDDIKSVMTSKKYRDFPILDRHGRFKGFISRRRFMNASKKKVILVDHNEKSQAVDGIEEAEIVEIIDHHRVGSIETINPVYFRNQPVGCTATIVTQMYKEAGIEPDSTIAGLLCSAIISDTLLFRSPTCTQMDKDACEYLKDLAGVELEQMAKEMFKAGSSLADKTPDEIIEQDFKQFNVDGNVFGVGQISSLSEEELKDIKNKIEPSLPNVLEKNSLDKIYFMLTNILTESTELVCCGSGAKQVIIDAFDLPEDSERIILNKVVSRKKQLIPTLVGVLQQ